MSTTVNLGRVVGDSGKINNTSNLTLGASENGGLIYSESGNTVSISADTNVAQEKLTGEEGQIVGFDVNGNPVAIDDPTADKTELYGYEITTNESNPTSAIRYIADNANFDPISIDQSTHRPIYGDWANAFFIKNLKPCMLNYNGTVAYELDKDDYTKKADGTASDVANDSFAGNAMVGIPTIWIKVDRSDTNKPKIYLCNKQLDSSYHAYAHHDNNGNVMPYTYQGIYHAWSDGTRLRSISGKAPFWNAYLDDARPMAEANKSDGSKMWGLARYADRMLIGHILLLLGKSTNTKEVFGRGRYEANNGGDTYTGAMDNYGLFYGDKETHRPIGVKTLGFENLYGNSFDIIEGWGHWDTAGWYYKLTYGTEDGSSAVGFDNTRQNFTNKWIRGGGYGKSPASECLARQDFREDSSIIPVSTTGDISKYFACQYYSYSTQLMYGAGNNQGTHLADYFSYYPNNDKVINYKYRICCKPPVV